MSRICIIGTAQKVRILIIHGPEVAIIEDIMTARVEIEVI